MKKWLKNEYEKEERFNHQLESLKKEAVVKETKTKNHHVRNVILITTAATLTPLVAFGVVLACVFLPHVEIKSYDTYKKVYAQDEINRLEQNTYRPLNSVHYPDTRGKGVNSDEYRNAVIDFSSDLYQNLGKENQDLVFSPYSLYMNLDILSEFSADENVSSMFDSVLGLNANTRKEETKKAFLRNYYEDDKGYTKFHNGLFLTNQYPYRQEVIDQMTDRYTESYSMDMYSDTDMNRMIDWVNKAVGKDALTLKDLREDNIITPDDEQIFYLFTTLSFKNVWNKTYKEADTTKDIFYSPNGEQEVDFMHHSYIGSYYDYGSYIGVTDYYLNGYSIQYLVPKKVSDNVFDLIQGQNIFRDDEEKRKDYIVVNLSLPKFSKNDSTNLLPILPKIGLGDLVDTEKDTVSGLFQPKVLQGNATLSICKQLNQIEFTEDGTTATTIQITGGMDCGAAAPVEDTIEVELNQPFVYIIKDNNQLPLYVGQVNSI